MQWLQLILALSLLVVIHELGHFCFARIFKVRVEKFYMFFNPKFSLIRAKKINGKWQVRFFAPNVEPSMVPQQDAMGNELKDEKGNTLYRPMTDEELATLPEEDWRRYPDNTEWGIGWCLLAAIVLSQVWWMRRRMLPVCLLNHNHGNFVRRTFGNACALSLAVFW